MTRRDQERDHSEKGGGKRAQNQSEEGRSGPEPRRDHGEEFDVAHSHAFHMPQQVIEPPDGQQNKSRQKRPEKRFARVPQALRQELRREQCCVDHAKANTGEREGIRQAHRLGVHHGQAEQEEAEYIHANAGERQPEAKKTQQKQGCGRELHGWVAPGDRMPAGSASASQDHPAQEGNIVERPNRRAAVGTMRARSQQGSMLRQACDADVEKAPESQAEENYEDCGEQNRGESPSSRTETSIPATAL